MVDIKDDDFDLDFGFSVVFCLLNELVVYER